MSVKETIRTIHFNIKVFYTITILLLLLLLSFAAIPVNAVGLQVNEPPQILQQQENHEQQPNINASYVYHNAKMVLGNNILTM